MSTGRRSNNSSIVIDVRGLGDKDATKALAKESGLLQDRAHLLHRGFTTKLARKQPSRCQCAPLRRGSPSTSSALQGGQGRGIHPVAHVGETVLAMLPLCCMTSQHVAAPRVVVAHPVYLKSTAGRGALQLHCLQDNGSCLIHASHAAVIGLHHDTTVHLAQD